MYSKEEGLKIISEVELKSEEVFVSNVRCGGDGTIFLTDRGSLYACGSNKVRSNL